MRCVKQADVTTPAAVGTVVAIQGREGLECLVGVADGQPEAAEGHALAVDEDAGAEDAGRKPKER